MVALFSEHGQPQKLARLFQDRHSKAVSDVADVNAVHLKQKPEVLVEVHRFRCLIIPGISYLQDHVPRQQAAIPGDDSLSVDVLDQDADQRSLVSTNHADGQRVRGV